MKKPKAKIVDLLKIEIDDKRVYGLDILRALAIFFVVLAHSTRFIPSPKIRAFLFDFVFDGVGIFFVLSGFLIGGILIKSIEKNKATFKTLLNFWIKRWFRTLPNYFLVLILVTFALPFLFQEKINDPLLYRNYFYFLQNFNTPHPNFFGEAWSLSVEEWFYLLIPTGIFILISIFRIKPKYAVLIIATLIIVFVTFIRYHRFAIAPVIDDNYLSINFRKQVITSMDSLMYGVLGAYLAFYYENVWLKNKMMMLIIGITLLLCQKYLPLIFNYNGFGIYTCVFSFSLLSIGTLLLLPFLSSFKKGKGFFFKIFTYLSLISYSMYLINYTIMGKYGVSFLVKYFSGTNLVFIQYSCFWIFTVIGSILLYKYFEKPVMQLRDRFK